MATTRSLTIADLEQMAPDEGRYEVIEGELIEMAPAGGRHAKRASKVAGPLIQHVDEYDLGEVYIGDPGFVLRLEPEVLLAPDLAFIRKERLPPESEEIGFLRVVPDLVLEVVSPSDRPGHLLCKVGQYLAAGVRLVWVVDPGLRTVTVYAGDGAEHTLGVGDDLDGGTVLPGFRLSLAAIFRQKGSTAPG